MLRAKVWSQMWALYKQLKCIYMILCVFRHNNKNIKSAKGAAKLPLTAARLSGLLPLSLFVAIFVKHLLSEMSPLLWVPLASCNVFIVLQIAVNICRMSNC